METVNYRFMFLSIIIPVYNTPELYLRECLNSCIKQNISPNNYEILCVDDGSEFACLSVLDEYKRAYPNIFVFSQKNCGVSIARNVGIQQAKGDYVWFVDSDDFIAHNSLEKLEQIAKEHKADRINLGAYHFFGEIKDTDSLKPNHALRSIFCTRSLYKRSFLNQNNLKFENGISLGEDMLFNFLVDQCQHEEAIICDVFYFYRIHDDSVSHRNKSSLFAKKFIVNHLRACEIVKEYFRKDSKVSTIRYLHADIAQIMIYISQLPYQEGKNFLEEIIKRKLLPFINLFSKKLLIVIYTNLYSISLKIICSCSRLRLFYWMLCVWAKIWASKPKKKIEKFIKSKIK